MGCLLAVEIEGDVRCSLSGRLAEENKKMRICRPVMFIRLSPLLNSPCQRKPDRGKFLDIFCRHKILLRRSC
jgi:hypothetical protein